MSTTVVVGCGVRVSLIERQDVANLWKKKNTLCSILSIFCHTQNTCKHMPTRIMHNTHARLCKHSAPTLHQATKTLRQAPSSHISRSSRHRLLQVKPSTRRTHGADKCIQGRLLLFRDKMREEVRREKISGSTHSDQVTLKGLTSKVIHCLLTLTLLTLAKRPDLQAQTEYDSFHFCLRPTPPPPFPW